MIPPIGGNSTSTNTPSISSSTWQSSLSQAANTNGPRPPHQYNDAALFGPSGGPRPDDVVQGPIGDCYFLAALASFAQQQPKLIRDAVTFDAATGNFNVTLYKDSQPWNPFNRHEKATIQVTQQEIGDHIAKDRGARVGNDGALWPVIMETARAKMLDGNPTNGLGEGYHALEHQSPFGLLGGGIPSSAMETISGQPGDTAFSTPLGNVGDAHSALAPWLGVVSPGLALTPEATDYHYGQVKAALADGRPVTLGSSLSGSHDGLIGGHAYQVEDIQRNADGSVNVTVRNPWGNNDGVGEGTNPADPRVTVRMGAAGLSLFAIGPSAQETGVG
jgi:hypothetical protein